MTQAATAVEEVPMTPEDEQALDGGDGVAVDGPVTDVPEWATLPPELKLPKNGKKVFFIKFEAALTDCPEKGDRQAILWNLTVADERLARARTFGDATRAYDEMAKQMIRAIDGKALPPGNLAVPSLFWDEIGPKYRGMMVSWYLKTHHFSDEDRLRFFGSCVATRSAV